ncbi:hypothetical protein ACFRAE_00810 [Sphingobacterium sp. HJSM2_6]|uniref:hypothetical protein n=1 Tax=Sphingobacterium sp. HJSM2_6 TaxID=3366264 RepID=UPI003BE3C7AC
MKYWVLSLAFVSLMACNNRQEQQQNDHQDALEDLVGRYEFHKGKDSIRLELKAHGDTLMGPLQYAFFEKDKNVGLFKGVVQDSILIGSYTFNAEGVRSTREIVFGILPNGLIEGFGDVKEVEGGMVFTDIRALQYDHGMILTKQAD